MSRDVLIRPIVSERSEKLIKKLGTYMFVVDKKANKVEIKKAIEQMYGVSVESVNTLIRPGKRKTRYTRKGVISGQTKAVKRAYITLAKGEVIDLFENISN